MVSSGLLLLFCSTGLNSKSSWYASTAAMLLLLNVRRFSLNCVADLRFMVYSRARRLCRRFPITLRARALIVLIVACTCSYWGCKVACNSVKTVFLAAVANLTTSATFTCEFVLCTAACISDTIMYEAARSALVEALPDSLPAGATTGCLGITSFIKQELVADNGAAPAVVPPRNGFSGKWTAAKGLRRGRKFDAEFQQAVAGGKVSSDVQQAVMLLAANNVVAVKCQQRVTTQGNKLTTLIDVVGIMRKRPHCPVVVELKTCKLPREVYESYAHTACRRTPMLRCVPHLPNSERVRHMLQAGYSAVALQQLLNVAYVASFVLVMCANGPIIVSVPKQYYNLALYTRLASQSQRKRHAKAQPKKARPRPVAPAVPAAARRALMLSGLEPAKTCIAKQVCLVSKARRLHGVALIMPTWPVAQAGLRQTLATRLQNSAKKCGKFPTGAAVPLYVVRHVSRQSKQLTVRPITAPFVAT